MADLGILRAKALGEPKAALTVPLGGNPDRLT